MFQTEAESYKPARLAVACVKHEGALDAVKVVILQRVDLISVESLGSHHPDVSVVILAGGPHHCADENENLISQLSGAKQNMQRLC